MLYLLDANVLIDASRDYYPLKRVPEFWTWLVRHGELGMVKVPLEIYEEIAKSSDEVARWIKDATVKTALKYKADVDPNLVARAVSEGNAPDLTEDEISRLGRDPFLLAYALTDPKEHCLVTTEVSKPGKIRANRHLPDVARYFGIDVCNAFAFTRRLDFRTNWRI